MEILDSRQVKDGITEIYDNLQKVESDVFEHILYGELDPYLDELLGYLHTIKGVAASCGLRDVMQILHEQEKNLKTIALQYDPSNNRMPSTKKFEELLDAVREIHTILAETDISRIGQEEYSEDREPVYTYVCRVVHSIASQYLAEIEVLEVFSQRDIEYRDCRSSVAEDGYLVEVDMPQLIPPAQLTICMQSKDCIIGIREQKQDTEHTEQKPKTQKKPKTGAQSKTSLSESSKISLPDSTLQIEDRHNISVLLDDFIQFEQNLYTLHHAVDNQNAVMQDMASQLGIVEDGFSFRNAEGFSRELVTQNTFYSELLKKIKTDIYNNIFEQSHIMHQNLFFLSRLKQALVNEQMIDLASVFKGFRSYIYTVAKQLNKKVKYVYEDQDISIDRQLVRSVAALLSHCIRNSLDHGIETTPVRKKLNKPEEATITIRAEQSSKVVKISITDDGGGLNIPKIMKKGVELGLLEEGKEYSDEEIANLIFLPKFSTSKKHTEFSGLGVGLSALQEGVQGFGGVVSVSYEKNTFTTFTMVIPISLNLHTDYIVLDNECYFAIPAFHVEKIEYCDAETDTCFPKLQALVGAECLETDKNIAISVKSDDIQSTTFCVNRLIGLHTVSVFPALFPVRTCIQALTITNRGNVCFVLNAKELFFQKSLPGAHVSENMIPELNNLPEGLRQELLHQTILECRLQSMRIGFPVSLVVETYMSTELSKLPVQVPHVEGIALVHGRPIPVWNIELQVVSGNGDIPCSDSKQEDKTTNVQNEAFGTRYIIVIQFEKYSIGMLVDEVIGTIRLKEYDYSSAYSADNLQTTPSIIDIVQQAESPEQPLLIMHPQNYVVSILLHCNENHG